MTYFQLFEIPVQLQVNTSELAGKFFQLSKKYHPDYYIKESAESQAEALEMSSRLNKAWKTFQNPDETIKYVLSLKNLIEEEEKYELPPDFLMEVLEINEALMDADELSDPDELKQKISALQKEIYEPVKPIVENYKDEDSTEKQLLLVKEYYYKKKYLDRINRQLAGKA
ncbi:MAG TPA: Fe-S protein assembly co-chaperone HscB [Chitinophagaceae bacterium]|nr:Fe-S protein assembly co-chaperone HscB [Chitinophagaceae bacterium]